MKKISAKKYAKALYEVTAELKGKELEEALAGFLQVLNKNKALKMADSIFVEFDKYKKAEEGIVDVAVSSASSLSTSLKKALEELVKKTKNAKVVNLTEVLDESLIGGIVLKFDNEIMDASLKTKLDNLNTSLKS